MKTKVRIRPQVKLDLVDQAIYIAEDAPETADAFLDACERCLALLAGKPEMGVLRHFGSPALTSVRRFPVASFEKHLVFYGPCDEGLGIIRVLHASRDIPDILKDHLL